VVSSTFIADKASFALNSEL